jgi:anti-sigma regulatory factor (Ser/Thr protein kinase)
MGAPAATARSGNDFRHEALLYSGEAGFIAGVTPFVREGLQNDEPVLVVLDPVKIELLRDALGRDSQRVQFADMREVGRNPALIIPTWHRFVDEHAPEGRRLRGVGEPIWRGRSPAELVECQRHEALLNVAFARLWPWWLLCPYDMDTLDESVLDEARRTHPHVISEGRPGASTLHDPSEMPARHLDHALPAPVHEHVRLHVRDNRLAPLRASMRAACHELGLSGESTHDLIAAVNEIATNAVRHGSGEATVRLWRDADVVLCEVQNVGRLDDPLAGRREPETDRADGRGLWMANQLCDLVQVRSSGGQVLIRLHKSVASD